MAIKFLSDVLGSGELESVTIEATNNITIGGSSDNALTISSGDVIVGGSSGTTGQVLTSNGSGNGTSWSNKTTNTNNFVDSVSFSSGTGVLTLGRSGLVDLTVNLDGRYLALAGGTMTGNIVITSLTTTSAAASIGAIGDPIANIYATNVSANLKGTIASTTTGTTATLGNDSTLIATTAFVADAISELPDNNTTYDLTTTPTGTGLRLDPSTGTDDDITFTGSGGLTITRNSDTQLTFNAPSAGATPTLDAVTTAGSTTTNAVTVGTITNNGSITTTTTASVGTNLTVFGNSSLVSLDVGGGFGSTGATISAAGNVSANGTLTIGGTSRFADTVTIVGTNTTNQESVLIRGISSNDGDFLGSIRTANTGGYNQAMRFYTSDANGTTNENLVLTLEADTNATFVGTIDSGSITSTGTVTATTFSGDLNGTINTLTTATTQSASNNSTLVATTAYVDTAIGTIPSGLAFEGNWNANTDTPDLSTATPSNGQFYIVSVAGNTNLDGITDWKVGDWAVYVDNGAGTDAWQKIDNTSTLGGFGSANKIAKWTATASLADSTITDDGTDITIGGDLTITGGDLTLGSNATTSIGKNFLKLADITGTRFIRLNQDETVDMLSASSFRTAIGAGTSSSSGVTSVAALTIGTTGSNLSSTVSGGTGTAVITLNVPTATATARGALSSSDWQTFNAKTSNTGTVTSVAALTINTTGSDLSSSVSGGTGAATITLSVPTASTDNRGALSSSDWDTFNGKMPLGNIVSGYNTVTDAAAIAVGVSGNGSALTYATDMFYIADGLVSNFNVPVANVDALNTTALTATGTSTLDAITSDKDITFTSGTSGGTGVVYDGTLVADGTYSGEVAVFGNSTSTDVGRLYQLQTTGGWAYADADAEASSFGLLAVATGTSSDDGMLLRGFIRNSNYSAIDGTAGAKLYVNTVTTNNSFTADIPTGSGDIVRIVGYNTTAGSKTIYFNPGDTYIQNA